MTDTAATLTAVTKRYGTQRAVVDIDLAMRPGERIGLVGHNGAGKSTLIKMMLGLVRPTSGRIEVLGEDPARGPSTQARMEIGYLPENVVFPRSMTGQEVLAFYARLKRCPLADNRALLERVGIAHAATRRIATYSKGMRQRLGLAQALLGHPRILLLDEPTSGLDPALRQSFYEIVAEMSARGASVLLSSHALAEVEGQIDRVVVMNRGRKVADGTLDELRRLARRPVRIIFTLAQLEPTIAPEAFGRMEWQYLGGKKIEVRCLEANRADVFRRLSSLPVGVEDIEIITPGLDAIYTHFLDQEAAE